MPDSQTFRIASYNIRKAIGGDWRRDPGRIQSVIAAIGADVVVLQEGDYRFRGRAPLFVADELLRTTDLTAVKFGHGEPGLGWHGNVLLVGPRIDVAGVRLLALPALEPRGALVADLRVGGRPVQVVAGHLGRLAWNRRRQARDMMRAAGPSLDTPVVALGDFNAWARGPGSLAPFRETMSEVACAPSYPARRPFAALTASSIGADPGNRQRRLAQQRGTGRLRSPADLGRLPARTDLKQPLHRQPSDDR